MLRLFPGYQSGGQERGWGKSLGGHMLLCKAPASFSSKVGRQWGSVFQQGNRTRLQAQRVQEYLGLSLQIAPPKNQDPLSPFWDFVFGVKGCT